MATTDQTPDEHTSISVGELQNYQMLWDIAHQLVTDYRQRPQFVPNLINELSSCLRHWDDMEDGDDWGVWRIDRENAELRQAITKTAIAVEALDETIRTQFESAAQRIHDAISEHVAPIIQIADEHGD